MGILGARELAMEDRVKDEPVTRLTLVSVVSTLMTVPVESISMSVMELMTMGVAGDDCKCRR